MKRRLASKNSIVSILVLLCWMMEGCSLAGAGQQEQGKQVNERQTELREFMFLDEAQGAWKDNSLDAYSAKIHVTLDSKLPKGYTKQTCQIFASESKAYVNRNYYEEKTDDGTGTIYQELGVLKDDGTYQGESYEGGGIPSTICGSDHLVWYRRDNAEGAKYVFHFWETDEDGKAIWNFNEDFLNAGENTHVQMLHKDQSGLLHLLVVSQNETWTYYVASTKGEEIACVPLERMVNNRQCYYAQLQGADESVYLLRTIVGGKDTPWTEQILRVDPQTGKEEEIVTRSGIMLDNRHYFPIDDRKLLYVNQIGVYRCDHDWTDPELLYRFSNHGISLDSADAYVRRNGEICVWYQTGADKHYLVLAPTTEKVEIHEVTLAAMPGKRAYYEQVVALFNTKYPSYHIEIKSDYDKTRLLTELVAGDGPVLIDSSYTGFYDQEKLWEPLDGLVESAGMQGDFSEKALELGKINGVTYGFVADYSVHSLITPTANFPIEEWTQERFLQLAEDPNIKAVFPPVQGNTGGKSLALHYLMPSMEDGYFFDAGNAKNSIDVKKLERLLDLAEDKCRDEGYGNDWIEAFREKKILCSRVSISNISSFSVQRERYGEGFSFVGYPTKDGGKNYITGAYPLCVRTTASEEDKIVAYTFLKLFLSYEGQMATVNRYNQFGISVRNDVFEEQMQRYMDLEIQLIAWMGKDGAEKKKKEMEEDTKTLRTIVDEAIVARPLSPELDEIFNSEFTEYYRGNISRQQLEDHLQKRIQLYLEEQE